MSTKELDLVVQKNKQKKTSTRLPLAGTENQNHLDFIN